MENLDNISFGFSNDSNGTLIIVILHRDETIKTQDELFNEPIRRIIKIPFLKIRSERLKRRLNRQYEKSSLFLNMPTYEKILYINDLFPEFNGNLNIINEENFGKKKRFICKDTIDSKTYCIIISRGEKSKIDVIGASEATEDLQILDFGRISFPENELFRIYIDNRGDYYFEYYDSNTKEYQFKRFLEMDDNDMILIKLRKIIYEESRKSVSDPDDLSRISLNSILANLNILLNIPRTSRKYFIPFLTDYSKDNLKEITENNNSDFIFFYITKVGHATLGCYSRLEDKLYIDDSSGFHFFMDCLSKKIGHNVYRLMPTSSGQKELGSCSFHVIANAITFRHEINIINEYLILNFEIAKLLKRKSNLTIFSREKIAIDNIIGLKLERMAKIEEEYKNARIKIGMSFSSNLASGAREKTFTYNEVTEEDLSELGIPTALKRPISFCSKKFCPIHPIQNLPKANFDEFIIDGKPKICNMYFTSSAIFESHSKRTRLSGIIENDSRFADPDLIREKNVTEEELKEKLKKVHGLEKLLIHNLKNDKIEKFNFRTGVRTRYNTIAAPLI